jgi:ankyrin repeat protein
VDERLRAVISSGDEGALTDLLRGDSGLSKEREGAISAVMFAAYHGQPAIARALLAARGPSDLFEAAALGDEERVSELIGWDPRAVLSRSADGFTALHLGAYFGHAGTVRRLIDEGADVEDVAENAAMVRPLHSGVAGRDPAVVEALLQAGADVDVRQQGGYTPLMGAAAGGVVEIVTMLVEAGADNDETNDEGKTALDIARDHGHAHLEELLRG